MTTKNNLTIMPIKKKYSDLIFSGAKTIEVRKKPLNDNKKNLINLISNLDKDKKHTLPGFTVLVYESGAGSSHKIVGQFYCLDQSQLSVMPLFQTQLTEDELKAYGNPEELWYLFVTNPIKYEKPIDIKEFGIKGAPQNIVYKDVEWVEPDYIAEKVGNTIGKIEENND